MDQWTIGTLLETAAAYLREKGSPSPRLDAELLLAETLGLDRIHLYMEFDRPLAGREVDRFRTLIARRAAHEPVAYILGCQHFRHLCLEVDRSVLIPRPETEELVEAALSSLARRPPWGGLMTAAAPRPEAVDNGALGPSGRPALRPTPLIADVGTGSGAIALSIAQETGVRVLATDVSPEALEVAGRNVAAAGLDALVELREADLLAGVPEGTLHLVVSNPPYVRSGDVGELAPDIRLFEPLPALDAGPDGLDVIRRLLPQAARALRPGGSILLEVGESQADAVAGLARDAGFAPMCVHRDLSHKERIVEAVRPGATTLSAADLGVEEVAALVRALEAGAVIGVPTDTVYGLATRWDSAPGVSALFAAKGRPPAQPVAVLFSSVEAVRNSLPDLAPVATAVLEALLPGPYTFVVSTSVPRPELVGTAESLGVRVPDHPSLLRLLRSVETPLAATSANPSGGSDPLTLEDVEPALLAHCSMAFTGSEAGTHAAFHAANRRPASTVVDLRPLSAGEPPVVLREGAISEAETLSRIAAL